MVRDLLFFLVESVMKIRPYRSEDLPGLVDAYIKAFAGPPWFEEWEASQVTKDFYLEIAKDGAICLVAISNEGEVIGFSWGYRIKLNSEHSSKLEAPNLEKTLGEEEFFYLDEVAVVPSQQFKGIGKKLFNCMQSRAQLTTLLRTKNQSPMCKMVLHMGGVSVQEISNNRVMMTIG